MSLLRRLSEKFPNLAGLTLWPLGRRFPVFFDYPWDNSPRWGYGKPPHAGLTALFEQGRAEVSGLLREFLKYSESLTAIPLKPVAARPELPSWENPWLPGLDIVTLYGMIARKKPKRYFEIGSGVSTKVARRAIADGKLDTEIVSIDPFPRAEVDQLCDRVIRKRLEDVDGKLWDELQPGDILFMDGSHRALMNTDATVFFLEILPALRQGVIVQIHDIHLPYDYPPIWRARYYSEQYLLAAWLLAGSRAKVLLPNAFIAEDKELRGVLGPLWNRPELNGVARHGGSFWMEMA